MKYFTIIGYIVEYWCVAYFPAPFFNYKQGLLHIEEVSATDIAQALGTPTYCYSRSAIEDNYRKFSHDLPANAMVCYAVKANPSLAILSILASLGAGADVVSGGEIHKAILAGIPPDRIVFSGVGKTEEEIDFALNKKILLFNVESIEELKCIDKVAKSRGIVANLALRINPGIDACTHEKITTGLEENKFGILEEYIEQVLQYRLSNITISGISIHIGSQISTLSIFRSVIDKVKTLVSIFEEYGVKVRTVNLGGGLGIPYRKGDIFPSSSEYSLLVKESFKDANYRVICEPGRAIVGNAGILLTKVLYRKRSAKKTHIIVDAGMNDLMRPALYGAKHEIVPVKITDCAEDIVADIVGPVCESDDTFALDRQISMPNSGDYLAICTVGAYGFSMSSNYNTRPLVAEVLVRGDQYRVIQPRQSYENMLQEEIALYNTLMSDRKFQ